MVCHCMFHGSSGPAALQRDDVIDDVAGPPVGVAGLRHELLPGLRAAGDSTVNVAGAGCAIIRPVAVASTTSAASVGETRDEECCDDRAGRGGAEPHRGEYDPKTGEQTKPPDPRRSVEP